MPLLTTCLWFDGRAEEAAAFYTGLFPRSFVGDVSRTGDGTVVTVAFTLDGQPFVGLDGGPQFPHTEAISFQVPCADQAEVDRYWDALVADGGSESRCGWCKDRFGVSWQVIPARLGELLSDPDPERAGRAMTAMLGMGRLDVAELERAADGSPDPAD